MTAALAYASRLAALPRQAVEDTKRILNLHLERAVLATLDFAIAAEDRSFESAELRANLDRNPSRTRKPAWLTVRAQDDAGLPGTRRPGWRWLARYVRAPLRRRKVIARAASRQPSAVRW